MFTNSQGLLSSLLSVVHEVIDPLPCLALRRHQAQMVGKGASSHKIYYVDILNLKGIQKCIIG